MPLVPAQGLRPCALSDQDVEYRFATTSLVDVDPRFVDPARGDYRLAPGSPLIDAGADVGEPFVGKAPDLGAFECAP